MIADRDRAPMVAAWRIATAALGVEIGACECALCGESPHPPAKTVRQFLPTHFPHPDLVDRSKANVCAGCVKIFGGRPSTTDPPLRTRNLVVRDGEALILSRLAPLREHVVEEGAEVVSWATSLKKHHLVHARVCRPGVVYVGSDSETLAFRPAQDGEALEAIDLLVSGFAKMAIIEGSYSPKSIGAFGATRWAEAESIVDRLRRRSPNLLKLLVFGAPKGEGKPEETIMETLESDAKAAALLGELAFASTYRVEHGKQFWGGYFAHRVKRFCRLPLPELVSRLMDELIVESSRSAEVVRSLEHVDQGATEKAIRTKPDLIVALAYDHVQRRRAA